MEGGYEESDGDTCQSSTCQDSTGEDDSDEINTPYVCSLDFRGRPQGASTRPITPRRVFSKSDDLGILAAVLENSTSSPWTEKFWKDFANRNGLEKWQGWRRRFLTLCKRSALDRSGQVRELGDRVVLPPSIESLRVAKRVTQRKSFTRDEDALILRVAEQIQKEERLRGSKTLTHWFYRRVLEEAKLDRSWKVVRNRYLLLMKKGDSARVKSNIMGGNG